MSIRLKSVYEKPSELDGLRVLTTQYWPRGVRKTIVDVYIRKLAPSRELLHSFKDGRVDWEGYKALYMEEISRPESIQELRKLKELSDRETVTIMCVCKDERECHRILLKALIEGSLSS